MFAASRSRHSFSSLYPSAALGGWVLPAAICALLLITLLVGGMHEVGRLLDARAAARLPGSAAIVPNNAGSAASSPTTDLSSLAGSLLFGRYEPKAAEDSATAEATPPAAVLPETSPGELPEAALGVTLRGVVYATAAGDRRAIVDGGSGPFKDYRIGESLPGEAVIRYIETRRIVVEKGGELLAVSLPETDGGVSLNEPALPQDYPPGMSIPEEIPGIPAPR